MRTRARQGDSHVVNPAPTLVEALSQLLPTESDEPRALILTGYCLSGVLSYFTLTDNILHQRASWLCSRRLRKNAAHVAVSDCPLTDWRHRDGIPSLPTRPYRCAS